MNNQGDETIPIHIPKTLYRRIEKLLEGRDTVPNYIIHLLRRHLSEAEKGEKPFTEEEEEEIKERLRALGYID